MIRVEFTLYLFATVGASEFLLRGFVALFAVKFFVLLWIARRIVEYCFFLSTHAAFCYLPDLAHFNWTKRNK